MQQEFWPVLIVDDEPDVLHMSELAMKDFSVFDVPIKLYCAESKAAAIELLSTKLTRGWESLPYLAVAFVDVVMESDTAGLELCKHIRETMGNQLTQLYIRTGQPGVAPEREVLDRYDINGYFTKVEATEDKLYSLVKSGVRQFYTLQQTISTNYAMELIAAASDSRAKMEQFLRHGFGSAMQDADGQELEGFTFSERIFVGELSVGSGIDEPTASELRKRLMQLPGVPLGTGGDKYVIDDERNILINIVGGPTRTEVSYVIQGSMAYPDVYFRSAHAFWSTFARLWHRAE